MNLKDDILIEHFLRNELSKEEITDFLNRLKVDAKFKNQFLIEKQLFQTLSKNDWSFIENIDQKDIDIYKELYNDNLSLKKTLEIENTNYQKSTKGKSTKMIYYIAASIVAIIFIASSIFNTYDASQKLYANYINNLDLPSLITRGSDKELAKAQEYFENKNYDKALPLFKDALQNIKQQKATLYIYTGITLTELNKYKEAVQIFDKLINSDLLGASKGLWFKAMLYIKMNERDNAKIILQKIISNSTNYNFKEAKKLLQKI